MNSTEKAEMLSKNGYTEIINDEYGIVTYDWFSPSGNRIASEANKAESAISAYRRAKRYLAEDTEPTPQLVVVPDVLADYRKQVEQLEARIANDAAYMTSLEAKAEKLQKDLLLVGKIIANADSKLEQKSRNLLDAIESNVQLKRAMNKVRDLLTRMPATHGLVKDESKSVWHGINEGYCILDAALAVSASEESSNAVQAVTLTVGGISGLAKMSNGTQFIGLTGMLGNQMLPLLIKVEERGLFTAYKLAPQFDTPANREAIEVCRQKMNVESAAIEAKRQDFAQS